jgi:dihydroorotase
MNILIKNATIIDPQSQYHNQQMDIHVVNGTIKIIEKNIANNCNATEVNSPNLHVSQGWIDLNCNVKEPGFEQKENLISVCNAAAQGGFTTICAMPTTLPITDSKSNVHYIINATNNLAVTVLPIGAITQQRNGKHLAEMYDMQQAGAVAFSDGKRTIADAGLVNRAMQYVKAFNGKLFLHNDDENISLKAHANEGIVSTTIGLKGAPVLAEHIIVQRNIMLAEYNNANVHLSNVSSAESLTMINNAYNKGIQVTADVAAHYLLLDEAALEGFDSNYKFYPPLRTAGNKQALMQALNTNACIALTSDHTPETIEDKEVEFENAAYGTIGLETAYSVARTATKAAVNIETLIKAFTYNPASIINKTLNPIAVGNKANLTLFDTELDWTFETKHIQSLCSNTPFIGTKFTGKAIGIINNDKFVSTIH